MNNEIILDDKSGISIEEQKVILTQIDGIAERNRRQLSQGTDLLEAALQGQGGEIQGKSLSFNAKKAGTFFPLAVNLAAIVVLAVGTILLVSFNGKVDAQVRTGSAVFSLTERVLIEEIRKDTAERITAKEVEITSISSRLREVDAQLLQLFLSNEDLTAEQLLAREELLSLQISYRDELTVLQNERSRILEDSRSREARLRAQFEERVREVTAVQQQTSAELNLAMIELERLSTEQERNAVIEAQLAGGISAIRSQIDSNQFDLAAQAIENLRQLNNRNTSRSFQTRREFYNRTLDSLEVMNARLRAGGGTQIVQGGADELLLVRNAQMEEIISEMQKTIDAFSSGSTGQALRLAELEESVSLLRSSVSSLEISSLEKDRIITSLERDRAELAQTVSARDNSLLEFSSIVSLQADEIIRLTAQLENIRQVLQSSNE